MFKDQKRLALISLLVGSSVGLIASIVLSVEALVLAKNADAILSCDVNAVISCAAVANHWSSAVFFGIPNSFFGMVAMPVVMTIAVVLLTGAKLPRWFMQISQLGVIGGLLFAAWMFYMSYSVIGILCPWCLTLDLAMIVMFFGLTRYNIVEGWLPVSRSANKKLINLVNKGYDMLIMWLLVVLMAAAIILKFGSDLFA